MGSKLTLQQQKAVDFNKHISLTANAGSGKTYVLKKRFVEIILQEGISLNNIVAITFTEKAAAKLYKDITEEIESRIESETNNKIINKLENIRRDLISANISTIHSFCTHLLKEFSPEAQIDANFIPIDPIITNDLIDLSIEELFKNVGKGTELDEKIRDLIRFFGSKKMLGKELTRMINKRDKVVNYANSLIDKSETERIEIYNTKFNTAFDSFIKPKLKILLTKIQEINDVVLENGKNKDSAQIVSNLLKEISGIKENLPLLRLFKKINENITLKNNKSKIKTNDYLIKKLREDLTDTIDYIENDIIFSIASGNFGLESDILTLIRFNENLIFVFLEALRIYERRKDSNGFLDFEDLLLKTLEILKNNDVIEILAKRFKYIMIDEYQDTNEVQFNIFMPILNHLKTNNLFVVGDEKQSIYMFREAELEIFNRTKELIDQIDSSGNLELTHSFRVSPKIALFTNLLFGKLFSETNIDFNEVKYSQLLCAHEDLDKGEIDLLISEEASKEADLVARKILDMVYKGTSKSFSDFAILCREKASFIDLEKSFVEYKIPYAVIGGTGFYKKQFVLDIYSFLSFIYSPSNDQAMLSVLRSPFFNISDATIAQISIENGDSFYEKLRTFSSRNEDVGKIARQLEKAILEFEYLDISDVLRVFLAETGYWGIMASKTDSVQEIANLEKLIGIILATFQRSFISTYDFLQELNNYIEELETESQAQISSNENAVKIMTLHKSKGLEFKTVVLFSTDSLFKINNIKSKEIVVDKNFGILTKVPPQNDYSQDYVDTPLNIIYNYVNYRKEIAENKRLLYVGVTRAIENLIVSATLKKDDNENRNNFIGLIKDGLKINLNSEKIILKGELEFLIDGHKYDKKVLDFGINIIRNVELDEIFLANRKEEKVKVDFDNLTLNINPIIDKSKKELFTASKFISFSFCPISYKLYYEYAYHKLLDLFDDRYTYENYKSGEEEETPNIKNESLIVGIISHKILSESFTKEELPELIKKKSASYFVNNKIGENIFNKTFSLLSNFFASKLYHELSNCKEYYNEYEISKIFGEYYLFGIMDKVLIYDDKIVVIDYKTNRLEEGNYQTKIEYYLPQLKFYGYLVSSYFGQDKPIELKLVFLEEPDTDYTYVVNKKEIMSIEEEIFNAIDKIRNNDYNANTKNCKKCSFNSSCKFSKI